MISPAELTQQLKSRARDLGFTLAGSCPAIEPTGVSRFAEWLSLGYGGEMNYLANRQQAYQHPASVLEGARSLLMLAFPYRTSEPAEVGAGEGRVSRYAWGTADYHDLIHDRLQELARLLKTLVPTAVARGVVDSAPLLEREFAQLAGLGWQGKHTLLINKQAGSYFFLAALLTDQVLEYDQPFAADHCGTCRACLDACPTDAFPQPYVLDASRCISYLTIELRQPIPAELRAGLGDWLFGCDVCQDVCPWNNRSAVRDQPAASLALAPNPDANPIDLAALFNLDDAAFRTRFRHTPLWRTKRRGILRNAAIILGNQKDRAALSVLRQGLNDAEPLVRGACAWAIGQIITTHDADDWLLLEDRLAVEADPQVRRELTAVLQERKSVGF